MDRINTQIGDDQSVDEIQIADACRIDRFNHKRIRTDIIGHSIMVQVFQGQADDINNRVLRLFSQILIVGKHRINKSTY